MLPRLFSRLSVSWCGAVMTALGLTIGFSPAGESVARAAAPPVPAQTAPAQTSAPTSAEEKPAPDKPQPEKPAPAKPTPDNAAPEKPKPASPGVATGVGELSATDRALLNEILSQAGAGGATLRSMERTPDRQVSVMLRLAQEDLAKAKAMYCSVGDRVLERFDAAASAEKNHAAMLEALVSLLPEAREVGCLNHIRNTDVLSVDVPVADVPDGQRTTLIKAAEAAVSAGKIARFLAPPREPDAFHFEFKRRSE